MITTVMVKTATGFMPRVCYDLLRKLVGFQARDRVSESTFAFLGTGKCFRSLGETLNTLVFERPPLTITLCNVKLLRTAFSDSPEAW